MADLDLEPALNAVFGTRTVHDWPVIPAQRPRWWQHHARRQEARINAALAAIDRDGISDRIRARFWEQARLGQCVSEDAGAYHLRCWLAALDLTYRPHLESFEAAVERMTEAACG